MAIDPKEIKSIEDSMVHDIDEEPKPEGMGVYLTLRFLSEVDLGVYGVMLLGMGVLQTVLQKGEAAAVFLVPSWGMAGAPFGQEALYFYFMYCAEPHLATIGTPVGKG